MREDWVIEGFHHVQLAMPPGGESAAERFYVSLGFDRIPKPAELAARGGCWFRAGETEVHLGIEPGFSASAKAHPALRIRGLAALRAALAAAGISPEEDTQLPGHARCYVHDPFGNRLELIEEVAS